MDIFWNRVFSLNIAKYNGNELPYKPLLLIFAIARYLDGHERLFRFQEVRKPLSVLFRNFAPHDHEVSPALPFWGLKRDGVWDIPNVPEPLSPFRNYSDRQKHLLAYDARGGLTADLYDSVRSEVEAAAALTALLDRFFPDAETQERVLNAVGIHRGYLVHRNYRDPCFSTRVLLAYRHRCAICGYSAYVEQFVFGIEAAHIMAHSEGGPDIETNGLALCVLHHRLFDHGVIGIDKRYQILVAQSVGGTETFDQIVCRYRGQRINTPQRTDFNPDKVYLEWHLSEVFDRFNSKYSTG